jgi:AraC family transcriptional regulator
MQQLLQKGTYLGNIATSRQFGDLLGSITTYHAEKEISVMHSHEQPHISFILAGGHIEKRKKSEQELFPGNMLFYYGEEEHLYVPKRFPASSINLEIEHSFFERYEISEAQLDKAIRENVDTVFLMLQVLKELVYNDPVSKPAVHCLLLQLLNNAVFPARKTTPHWAIDLKQLLNDQWENNFSLEELSVILNVHPVTISKHFRSIFSCTLGAYMRKVKVSKALALVHSHSYSLTEIAYRCGFADQSHFIRTFKSNTGLLPKQYQKISRF